MIIQSGWRKLHFMVFTSVIRKASNVGLQLRRALSIRAEGRRLLEKDAIAPSAARLCYAAGSQGLQRGKHLIDRVQDS
jgi:hypothetical protein